MTTKQIQAQPVFKPKAPDYVVIYQTKRGVVDVKALEDAREKFRVLLGIGIQGRLWWEKLFGVAFIEVPSDLAEKAQTRLNNLLSVEKDARPGAQPGGWLPGRVAASARKLPKF